MSVKKRVILKPEVRADQIMSAAIRVIKSEGWKALSRERVAAEADCAVGTINSMYGTMELFRKCIMRQAIKLVDEGSKSGPLLKVIAVGLSTGDKDTKKAPDNVKRLAYDHMMKGVG